ncbi:hypothetical protein LI154_07420, partial [[Clostridium] scindens]|nr:hypothetical protein [[Clostridium] scindens]
MKTAYIHCTLLDGSEDMIPQENMTVVEEEGKILEIGGDIVPEPGDKVIDLGGRYLMPGLINLHVHLPCRATLSGRHKQYFIIAIS